MVVGRPWTHREAYGGEDGVERQGWEARPWGERHARDPGQRGAERTGGFMAWGVPMGGRRWGAGVGVKLDQGIKGAEAARNVWIAGRALRLGTIRARAGWGEREDLCRPVIPRQRLGTRVRTGCAASVSLRCEGPRVALPSDPRTEQAQASHPGKSPKNVVEMARHGLERLWPRRPRLDRSLDPMVPMAEETPELAEGRRRPQRRRPPPIRLPLVEPPTLEALRVRTPRNIWDVAGLAASDRHASGREDGTQGEPVHPGRGQHDRGKPTGRSPVGEPRPRTGKSAQWLDRVGIAIRGHTAPGLLSPHIDAGGMRVEHGQMCGRGGSAGLVWP